MRAWRAHMPWREYIYVCSMYGDDMFSSAERKLH